MSSFAHHPPASLQAESLSFCYPGSARFSLENINFAIPPGQRVGLLGPNGAGKTTLMRICCGYLLPKGQVKVADLDVVHHSLQVREQVGYLPEQVPLYDELRVVEHLNFRAAIKHIPWRARSKEIHRVCELTGLISMLNRPIWQLSRGYRQRVGIADALLGCPPLVILDEPTVGLDPNQVIEIRSVLRNLGGTQTLIFSSHVLAEVELLCDRVLILANGKLVADELLSDAIHQYTLIGEWDASQPQVSELLRELPTSLLQAQIADTYQFLPSSPTTRAQIICRSEKALDEVCLQIGRLSVAKRLAVIRLERGRRPLEEHFARVTGGESGS